MGSIEARLVELGIGLQPPPTPEANYVPYVLTGNLLFVAGQTCYEPDGVLVAAGKLGGTVALEAGISSARQCAINILAVAKLALIDLDRITQVVRLGGFVNSTTNFIDGPKVLNGASDLLVAVFGERGRHARTTVGVATLPGDAAVEVDAIFAYA